MLSWEALRFPFDSSVLPWLPSPTMRAHPSRRPPCQDRGSVVGMGGRENESSGLSGPAGADYGQISEETWAYLHSLYGGGPETAIRQSLAQPPDPESLHGEQKIEAETRAV